MSVPVIKAPKNAVPCSCPKGWHVCAMAQARCKGKTEGAKP